MAMDVNMQADTIVAIRQVHEGVKRAGGVVKVDINDAMLRYVNGSRAKYREHLKKKQDVASTEALQQKEFEEELNVLNSQIVRLEKDAAFGRERADKLAAEAEDKESFRLIRESNEMRKMSAAKLQEAETLRKEVDEKKKRATLV